MRDGLSPLAPWPSNINLIIINEIRQTLAEKDGADIGCPTTTGIFALIAANAAMEEAAEGKNKIRPYWLISKSGGELKPKYPGWG
jgi:hypothetical protein